MRSSTMIGFRLRSPLIRLGVSRAATALTASVAARVAAARRFSSVVDSAWVRAGGEGGEKLLLLDCEQETAFRRAHIPGALPFLVAPSGLKNPTPSTTGLITEEQFESIIEGLQLDADATLVFYDDDASMKAIRMWWVFHHFGFPKEQLKVLDGGWKQWVADSSPVETALPTAFPAATTPWSFKATTNALVGLDEVKQGIESGVQFVDARSPAEYTGANPAGNARGGHVPGAINFNWVNAVDLASTGRFKSKSELESVLVGELGLDKKKPVITYCQRGIRAAHTAFVLQEVAGFEDVKVYEDSMLQYLNRDDTAVEK